MLYVWLNFGHIIVLFLNIITDHACCWSYCRYSGKACKLPCWLVKHNSRGMPCTEQTFELLYSFDWFI